MLGRVIRRVVREVRALRHPFWNAWLQRRIDMTCGCADAAAIPKVPGAGRVFWHDGRRVQRMHQGILVRAGGYDGAWMTEIIRQLQGHHEPQEELLFHHLLPLCRPGSRMVEIGAFWAYYTAWFLSTVPGSTAVCLEPDAANAACGQETLALNGLTATWVAGAAGRTHAAAVPLRRESDGEVVTVPVHCLASLLDVVGNGPVEMLHIDAQGAELPFLESLGDAAVQGVVRFVVVSTHHGTISGSPTTHEDCLRLIRRLGGVVLAEHSVEESFSGDGLIVGSFDPADAGLALPEISRNHAAASLFGVPAVSDSK
jgi:FkbM family methyltransferase